MWIKRTSLEDLHRAMTRCASIGEVGEVEVFYDQLPFLTSTEIVQQFNDTFPDYKASLGGETVTVGNHTVITRNIVEGLWEAKRREDFSRSNQWS